MLDKEATKLVARELVAHRGLQLMRRLEGQKAKPNATTKAPQ